jgi:hypothetical protein
VRAKTYKNHEKLEAAVGSGQEEMRATICSTWAELEDSMNHWVEDAPVSLDHRTQGNQAEVGTKKTLVDTAKLGLEAKSRMSPSRDSKFVGASSKRH